MISLVTARSIFLPPPCRGAVCDLRRGVAGLAREVDTPSAKLKRAFGTLGLEQDECTVEDIRKAYIRLAKKYHPDSTQQADTEKFVSIRDAYKQCTTYAKNMTLTREIHEAMEQELRNMDRTLGLHHHRKVAHRQYLQYDGVGPGTTSERQKAHTQLRLNQSRDSVFEKKFQDALENNDTKEVGLYSPWPKSTQVTNNLERIANEMIRDAIRKGEFSDLPGRGRPMENTYENPVLSTMEQKINIMLGSSGFAPDWIMLDREIKVKCHELKEMILVEWNRYGPRPMSHTNSMEWEQKLLIFQQYVDVINKKIRDRNLKGPLVGQKVNLKLENIISQVTSDVIPVQSEAKTSQRTSNVPSSTDNVTFGGFVVASFVLLWGLFR